MAHVLVTGAAGLLGSRVCQAVRARGGRVSALVRRIPDAATPDTAWKVADLLHPATLKSSLFDSVEAIVHCATNAGVPCEDGVALNNLLGASGQVPHFVYVGIAGIDNAGDALAYYRTKLDCEARLLASGRPCTIVRATQFHELIDYVLHSLQKGPFLLQPRLQFQPVDVGFVADRLADRALGRAEGRVQDVHGPQSLSFAAMSDAWLRARRERRLRVPIPAYGLLRGFSKLTHIEGEAGGLDWATWLASHGSGRYKI